MTLYDFFGLVSRVWNKLVCAPVKKCSMAFCGKNTVIGRGVRISGVGNLSLGDGSSVGEGCRLMCTRAKINIGDHVMLAPDVTVITGSHRIDLVGKYISDVGNDEKLPENDRDVVLEGDNWICAGSFILKGVTIGRGAIVAAGSVVTKDVPPYSVVGGVPARLIRMRFDDETLQKHISALNQKDAR